MNPVLAKIQAGAFILDVRNLDEFEEGAYPNAVLIPVSELSQRLSEVGSKDQPVVVYCKSGRRSAVAEQILRTNGWQDVTNGGGLEDMPN